MLGVCYYPEQWPESMWASDARRMVDLGISFVRIGEFAWTQIEPKADKYDWAWLDRAIETLAKAGLKIVLGTPTATPPRWLVDQHPDILPVDSNGRIRHFGSRRHYCFSSPIYRTNARRIVEAMAKRYGHHPAVIAWQTDNEYGCHNTTRSYSPAAIHAFRVWLNHQYHSVDKLNEAWGNNFWSMRYRNINEIEPPMLTVTEANPAHRLDWYRFSSEQVASFNREQVEMIHRHSPGRPVTHNFMGCFTEFDHWDVGSDLDFASWDSYPLGFTDTIPWLGLSEADRQRYAQTGHPDVAAFHHDLYRAMGRSPNFWVMEQQPGPVNWAMWNPAPADGMVRLWTWEAFAHGASAVSYFRWRQAPFAQEQMHAGLNRADDVLDVGGEEAAQVAAELKTVHLKMDEPLNSEVALVFDYPSMWMHEIQHQGFDFQAFALVYSWYGALRRLGYNVDIVPPGKTLQPYKLVVAPTLPHVSGAALGAIYNSNGTVLLGPRSGSKTRDFQIPPNLAPGNLQDALGLKVTRVESLRPGTHRTVTWGNRTYRVAKWAEHVELTHGTPIATFTGGAPAIVTAGQRFLYVASWADGTYLDDIMRLAARQAGLPIRDLPPDLRLRQRHGLTFAFNYGPEPLEAPAPSNAQFLLGSRKVNPHDLAVWRE